VIVDFGPFFRSRGIPGQQFLIDRKIITACQGFFHPLFFFPYRSTIRYDTGSPAQPYPDHFMPILMALGAAGPGKSWHGGVRVRVTSELTERRMMGV